ncbi:Protein disulfide-isomerase 5-4 [Ancistrocladus abbreviatus]
MLTYYVLPEVVLFHLQNRLNITKTIRKFSIDSNLKPTGSEFHSGPVAKIIKHDDESDDVHVEGSAILNAHIFDRVAHKHDILVVNFYAPWCSWSNRLKPSWEKAAQIVREKYDPETDGRILLGKVDCTLEGDLCRRHHIQGYPSIRIFRKGSDIRGDHGHHDHESYYGDRDTDSLVEFMETLVAPIPRGNVPALEDKSVNLTEKVKRPAPVAGGCRLEGSVRVKKIEHYLQVVKTEVVAGRPPHEHTLIEEYEYTTHSSLVQSPHIPAAKFHFELSPMQVLVTENPKSLAHFLTNVCAIIGGVFTVAGIVESILHNTIRVLKKGKMGKHF